MSLVINQHLSVSLKDPSRNHRAYRLTVAKLEPPLIPFMPLLIKGNSKETHRSSQGGVCGEENEQELSRLSSLERMVPSFPLHHLLSPLTFRKGLGRLSEEQGFVIWKT